MIVSNAKNAKVYFHVLQENLNARKVSKRKIERAIERVDSKLVAVQSDAADLFEVMEKAVEMDVPALRNHHALLVLPDEAFYSLADVSKSYIKVIQKQAKRYLKARSISFKQVQHLDSKHLLLDLIIDASEEQIELHRNLSKKFQTVYIITRNPHLAEHFRDKPHVVTRSLSPLVMGYVFRKIAQLSQGGV